MKPSYQSHYVCERLIKCIAQLSLICTNHLAVSDTAKLFTWLRHLSAFGSMIPSQIFLLIVMYCQIICEPYQFVIIVVIIRL